MTDIQLLFCLKYFLVALCMFGSSHALGCVLTLLVRSVSRRRSSLDSSFVKDPLLQFFFHTILGFACWSYLVFFLGVIHLLYPAPLWAVFIISIIIESVCIFSVLKSRKIAWTVKFRQAPKVSSANEIINPPADSTSDSATISATTTDETTNDTTPKVVTAEPVTTSLRWGDSLFIILLLFYGWTLFLPSLQPPHIWDDISYHLPFARLYADSHALALGKFLRYPVINQFAELLFTATYMLVDARATQLVSWNAGMLTLIGIYAFLREKFGPYTGLIGVLIMCSSRVLSEAHYTAYVETTLCLLIAGFLIALLNASSENRRAMLILAGTCAGCAVATKYTAAVVISITLGVWLLAELISRTAKLRDLGYFLTPAVIVTAPWFIRNAILSGNPVFPFFSNVFGLGGLWNKDDLIFQWLMWKSRCVMPVNTENIFNLPYFLSFECYRFRDSTFSRLAHYAIICTVLAVAIKRERVLIVLLVITEAFLLWWFYTCQNVRYALPVLPAVAIAGAWASHTIWLTFSRLPVSKMIAAIGLALVIALGITKGAMRLDRVAPVCETKFDEENFLRKSLPTYSAYEFLNGQEAGNLYALFDDRMNFYYTNGTFIGSDFGPGRWGDFLYSLRSREHLFEFIEKFKLKYILVSHNPPEYWVLSPSYAKVPNLRNIKGLQLIFENNNVTVYRVLAH